MIKWLSLGAAILGEVAGTLALRAAVDERGWAALAVAGYVFAFALLGLTLRAGMPVGVAYGVWGASGVALTAVAGALLFGEALGPTAVAGLVLIVVGVVLIESGSHPRGTAGADGAGPGDGSAGDPTDAPGAGRRTA
ncbi:SMR family transporter [Zhihengliuella sp.]|uniref:DMT family transporter n=1 Tax=Zhihengliuella sp. TaxID=1954483 RepID=UPI0028111CD8|nr:SMR family transporter [Zhihengliuella sp.]